MPMPDKTSAPPVEPRPVAAAVPVPSPRVRWSSRTLLAGQREVEIEHDNVVYRLQLTSLGKLILTK